MLGIVRLNGKETSLFDSFILHACRNLPLYFLRIIYIMLNYWHSVIGAVYGDFGLLLGVGSAYFGGATAVLFGIGVLIGTLGGNVIRVTRGHF